MADIMVSVAVVKARGLPAADLCGTSDPYCVVKCEKAKKKTRVLKKTLEPVWEENFTFPVSAKAKTIIVECYDKDTFKFDDPLGKMEMEISALDQEAKYYSSPRWYQLIPMRKGPSSKRCGEVMLSFEIIGRRCEPMTSASESVSPSPLSTPKSAAESSPACAEDPEPMTLSPDALAAGLSLHDDGLGSDEDDDDFDDDLVASEIQSGSSVPPSMGTKSFRHGRSASGTCPSSSSKKSFRIRAPTSSFKIKCGPLGGKSAPSSGSKKSGKSFRMLKSKSKSKTAQGEAALGPVVEDENALVAGRGAGFSEIVEDESDAVSGEAKSGEAETDSSVAKTSSRFGQKAPQQMPHDDAGNDGEGVEKDAENSVHGLPAIVFGKYDVDANGVIDRDEFNDMVLDLGYYFEPTELHEAFAIVDADGDGHINVQEFASFWRRDDRFRFLRLDEERRQKVKQLSEFFAYFDRKKRGMLDRDEFIALHEAMVVSGYTALGDTQECMRSLDINSDGFVHFNELLAYAVGRGLLDTTQVA